MRVVVVGASGYVGGRLVDKLRTTGIEPIVVGRDLSTLRGRWPELMARRLDLAHPETIEPALAGVDVAFYLARQWDGTKRTARLDADRVQVFHAAARQAGLQRVIHLARLWDMGSACGPPTSADAGLAEGAAPAITEIRSGMLVGSGSVSFEILRYLVERQPMLLAPRWTRVRFEPVSTGDISSVLVAALQHPEVIGRVEVGCGEPVTFEELMWRYGRARELRRRIVRVPLRAARASAAWIHVVSPVSSDLALPFVRSLATEHSVRDPAPAARLGVVTRRVDEMLSRAIDRRDSAATTWFDAVRGPRSPLAAESNVEGMYRYRKELVIDAPREAVFAAVTRIGGAAGWPNAEPLWQLRGLMDRAVGGPGMRRGRRHPTQLRVGDVVDFWRVEACEAPEILRLTAEMKLPGRAWLEFELTPADGGRTQLVQTAYYEPHGVLGFLYWWSVFPFHSYLFGGMIRELGRHAEALAAEAAKAGPAAPNAA